MNLDGESGPLATSFSEAYNVWKQPSGRLRPRCVVFARGLNPPLGRSQSPGLDSHHDHALDAAVLDPALHGDA